MIKTVLTAAAATLISTAAFAGSQDLKEAANNAFVAFFADHSEEGERKSIAEDIIQHNPFVPTGRGALIGFLPGLKASGITHTNLRILQDGDFVVLHNSFTNAQAYGAPKSSPSTSTA